MLFTIPILTLLLLDASSTLSARQRGALTVGRNLADLVAEAGVILSGRIVSTRVEPHLQFSALWTVLVTLEVEEAIKGANTGNYTFCQFIWDPRDRQGAAGYLKGQRLLLLLTAPSSNGLSSPVGSSRGAFRCPPMPL